LRVKYYKVSVDAVSEKLMEILEGVPEVKIAVLFGSVLRRSYVRGMCLADLFICLLSCGSHSFLR